jgi:hypothetical protein
VAEYVETRGKQDQTKNLEFGDRHDSISLDSHILLVQLEARTFLGNDLRSLIIRGSGYQEAGNDATTVAALHLSTGL